MWVMIYCCFLRRFAGWGVLGGIVDTCFALVSVLDVGCVVVRLVSGLVGWLCGCFLMFCLSWCWFWWIVFLA